MAMNRKERRRARALGEALPESEQPPRAVLVSRPSFWSIRSLALIGGLVGLAASATMFGADLSSSSREVVAEAIGKCLGGVVLGAVGGTFMAIGRSVARR